MLAKLANWTMRNTEILRVRTTWSGRNAEIRGALCKRRVKMIPAREAKDVGRTGDDPD